MQNVHILIHYLLITGPTAFLVEKIESGSRAEASPEKGGEGLFGAQSDAKTMVRKDS